MSKRPTMLIVIILLFLCILLLASPVFHVKKIIITGNNETLEADILRRGGLETETNIFLLPKEKTKEKIKTLPYVKDVHIEIIYPNQVQVSITERRIGGYIPYDAGSFLYIDETARVLGVGGVQDPAIPIIAGLEFESFSIGSFIDLEDTTILEALQIINELLDKYDIDTVQKIDLSDPTDIHLFINHTDIIFGDIKNADIKMSRVFYILEHIEASDKVRLYVNDIDIDPRLEYIK